MLPATSQPRGALPSWAVAVGSMAILFHLTAITIPFLDTPSGPWPLPIGRSVAEPPQFAHSLAGLTTFHAKWLRIAHSYHFVTNRPGDYPAGEFEVRLTDDAGKVLRTVKFPNPEANRWVRHRQELLAGSLALDVPVELQGGEVLPAPNARPTTMGVWLLPDELAMIGAAPPSASDPKNQIYFRSIPLHLVPRDRPVMRPLELSQVLARSYARYLCREHGAARAEIIRSSRMPVPPVVLFGGEAPAQAFESSIGSFGEMSP
jgi:hypothetical protein